MLEGKRGEISRDELVVDYHMDSLAEWVVIDGDESTDEELARLTLGSSWDNG